MNKKKRWSLTLFLVTAVTFLLSACGITSGEVIDKHYEEPYFYTTSVCSGYNAQGYCIVWVPITSHVDEKWVFTLKSSEGKTGDLDVSKEDYDNVPLGTIYTQPEKE
jgi:hypothetical protein